MPFADELIGVATATTLERALSDAAGRPMPELAAASAGFAPLSLRERSDVLRDAMLTDIGGDYDHLAATVRAAAAGALPFSGWLIWPVTSAVAQKAVDDGSPAAFDDALALLAELTPRLSSEFAIRTLLLADLDRALPIILEWTTSPDEHVRRLASEGTRSFLPWARRVPALVARPDATIPILDRLYRDDSEYVRRSVANHLNDFSRQHPDVVVATAKSWLTAPDDHTGRLVRHALRTVVKKGHPGALTLLGFDTDAELTVVGPTLDLDEVAFGETITFSADISNAGPTDAVLAIDYAVHHMKANGSQTAKTFKLATRTLAPGETISISRSHSLRAITTRRYYPGAHGIELQINGASRGRADFALLPAVPDGTAEPADVNEPAILER